MLLELLVAGPARSGTSMTCQVLDALGVGFGSGLARADQNNRLGYWENAAMRRVLKTWLQKVESDTMGQWPIPPRTWRPTGDQIRAFRADVERVLGPAEAHKDAKTLPLWPLFRGAFPAARWVVVRRAVEDIASSCMRTTFMHRFRTLPEWTTWAVEMHRRMDDLVEETGAIEVWPDARRPESFRGMADALGLEWNAGAVRAVLDPKLWRAGAVPA